MTRRRDRCYIQHYPRRGFTPVRRSLVRRIGVAPILARDGNAARAQSGGTYHSRSDITGIGSGGDGKTSYVMGKDWSVVIGD